MLYPPEVVEDPGSDGDSSVEEVDERTTVRKKRKLDASSDFSTNFVFEDDMGRIEKDDLKAVRPYLRKSVISSLQEKIDRERKLLLSDGEQVVDGNGNDDMELVQELDQVADKIKEKSAKKKGKKLDKKSLFDEETSAHIIAASSSNPLHTFHELNLSRPLLKAVNACGFTEPTPIQSACIRVALEGRDICACAATGTGKTAAFMVPILERLLYKPKKKSVTRVLVLVPTRELAIQVFQVSQKLAQFMSVDVCLCAGIFLHLKLIF
uniref:RNA helicase n=1 Tax=Syphacia muris TaxID=451379 RepID=A0A0N5AAZ8_9BILA